MVVTIEERIHLFPFRTQKLSSLSPKVLSGTPLGRIGCCHLSIAGDHHSMTSCFFYLSEIWGRPSDAFRHADMGSPYGFTGRHGGLVRQNGKNVDRGNAAICLLALKRRKTRTCLCRSVLIAAYHGEIRETLRRCGQTLRSVG